jgi:hypothetical protein
MDTPETTTVSIEERAIRAQEMAAEAQLRQAMVAERLQALREAESEDRKTLLHGAVDFVGSVTGLLNAVGAQEMARAEIMRHEASRRELGAGDNHG